MNVWVTIGFSDDVSFFQSIQFVALLGGFPSCPRPELLRWSVQQSGVLPRSLPSSW